MWTIKKFEIDLNEGTTIKLPSTGTIPKFLKAAHDPHTNEACIWVFHDNGDDLAKTPRKDKYFVKAILSENDSTKYLNWTYVDTIYQPETEDNFAWTWHVFVTPEKDAIVLDQM